MTHNNADSLPIRVSSVQALRNNVREWKNNGLKTALVPTMGALHDGHLSLVREAQKHADKVITTIFVNPTQFAAHEDLSTYPRQEEEDIKKLAAVGCDLVFTPSADEMYGENSKTTISVSDITDCLCGASRPHFFGGVATIVAKLLNQAQTDFATFGEKDYQQLLVIKRMAADLFIDTKIIGAPLIREKDGLAMSSRNAYLDDKQRAIAGLLNKEMRSIIEDIKQGSAKSERLSHANTLLLEAGFDRVDYLEIRTVDRLTLTSVEQIDRHNLSHYRLFAAAYLGKTRLIDNMPLA